MAAMAQPQDAHQVELETAVRFALEEARMVLPGIQALFGFQLVAVVSQRFGEIFDTFQQGLHLGALVLTAVSFALAMTPAAYHRQFGTDRVSAKLLRVASVFIGAAMVPLMIAVSIDIALLTYAISQENKIATMLGAASFLTFGGLWIVFPQLARRWPARQD